MPELPEVETIVRTLNPKLSGKRITGCLVRLQSLFGPSGPGLLRRAKGNAILGLRRRGKMILIDCAGGVSLVFHLKMTGQLLLVPKGERPDKHTHLILHLDGFSHDLRFRDVRKFGFVRAVPTGRALDLTPLGELGPEPLETNAASFSRLFRGRRARIKSLLLDQRFLAGIGNIYADEILFRAGLHPRKPADSLSPEDVKRLWKSVRSVLRRAVLRGGSTIRDYRDSDGARGRYQEEHRVYGRKGRPCSRCTAAVERILVGGRSTFFCPNCQP